MGIKLSSIVKKREISFDDMEKKKIAVDASNMLFQFISSIRQRDGTPLIDSNGNTTSHLVGIFSRITNLMSKEIKVCFIFDGKPPELKAMVKKERERRKQIAEDRLREAENEEELLAYSKQSSRLTKEIIDESKELITALGLPCIQAPSEAEAQASYMCKNKDVDYVASSDYDCLIYQTPRLLTNLTLSQKRRLHSGQIIKISPYLIELDEVLNMLDISNEQLLVLAILTGTDYNPQGIPGIGPKKALKLVKEHKDYDKMFSELNADFDWKEVYNTFKKMPVDKKYELKWKPVDTEKIKKMLVDEHDFNLERVEKTLENLTKVKKELGQKTLGDF